MRLFRKVLLIALVLFVVTLVGAALVIRTIPAKDTNLTHFDSIIVLGYPANPDGSPSPEQRERTLEGVREYKAGVAPAIIFTGGAAHNQFVEAHVMATLAEQQGVPHDAIFEEDEAQNTIQNIYYSNLILANEHWRSAEVVSSPSHLTRTALILEHYPSIQWRTQAAPWPSEYNIFERAAHYAVEDEYCLKLQLFGFPKSHFLPNPPKGSQ